MKPEAITNVSRKMDGYFEQGPIRPPSEARSLLIRVTRNCPWNKCAFCRTYRDQKFELRSLQDIKADITAAGAMCEDIQALSVREGEGGLVTERIVQILFDRYPSYLDQHRSVGLWLYYGGESIFFQDADSLVMKSADIASVLLHIRETFPLVKRITTYCRSKTAARKSVEELKMLADAGLSRIHIGMESGYDPLLKFIRKGVTAKEHIEGGQKVKAAGISLSEYVIPGLGGERWTKEHARETARVIRAIDPDFIRLRSLYVTEHTSLMDKIEQGEFTPLSDDNIVQEIKTFVEGLEGIQSTIVSDHILNLLEEVEGKLPDDKAKILALIDRYFSLTKQDRLIFRLGRRQGLYRRIDDLYDQSRYHELHALVERYERNEKGSLEKHLSRILHNYI